MGHVAVAVDSQAWADELVLLHGGLGSDRAALADLYLLSSNSWSHPQTSGRWRTGPLVLLHGVSL